jgi:hypothetical protein
VKTTVEITDALLKKAKRYAAEHDITLREVIEQGVRHVVQPETEPKKPFKLRDASFHGGKGMVKDFTWEEILNIIYEGRGGTG